MRFDHFTIALSLRPPDAPLLDEQAAAAVQDAHLSHLANLHEAGWLLAAGPLEHPRYRGLSILNVEPERARELKAEDAAMRAGILSTVAIPDGSERGDLLLADPIPALDGRDGMSRLL